MSFRPWDTIEEMNQGLVERHNSVVKPDDITIWLGDVVMGGKKHEAFRNYILKMNGTKIWLLGNHDRGFDNKDYAIYEEFGITIYTENIWLNQIIPESPDNILLSHFPFVDALTDYDERYKAMCPIDDGKTILFHGHNHVQVPMKRSRMINIGVDAWNYTPVAFERVMAQLEAHDRYPVKELCL